MSGHAKNVAQSIQQGRLNMINAERQKVILSIVFMLLSAVNKALTLGLRQLRSAFTKLVSHD
jgi:hypothetical protein